MRVVVVGAGLSGLVAASELHQSGAVVTVVEARTRIGGRIFSQQTDEPYALDHGASWIHNYTSNPLAAVAKGLGLHVDITHNPTLVGDTVYDANGARIPVDAQNRLRGLFHKAESSAATHAEANAHLCDESLESALLRATPPNLSAADRHFLDWMMAGQEGWDAAALQHVSARFHFREQGETDFYGGDGFVVSGFGHVVQALARTLPPHAIRLGCPVSAIHHHGRGVRVLLEGRPDEEAVEADYLVCTLPLGVLKARAVAFCPPLPDWKQQAIDHIGMGLMNKIFLVFNTAFWDKTDGFGYVSSLHRGEFGFFLSLSHLIKHPVLICFVAADFAHKVETWSDQQIVDAVMAVLQRIYGANIPAPTKSVITRWGRDPYARGSYAYMRLGCTLAHLDDIARPVGRLYFAGEATVRYPGYTHGAYKSGKRAAKSIRTAASLQHVTEVVECFDACPSPSPARSAGGPSSPPPLSSRL